MENSEENKLACPHCNSSVKKDDDFCPDCGTLFAELVKCINHNDKEAKGVCVICSQPFCEECGIFVDDKVFLCSEHSDYETIEGMACVLNGDDTIQIGFAKSSLETSGLHPFIFTRNSNAIYQPAAYNESGESNGYFKTEIYLMVPFQEVIRAEEILDELNILDE